MLFLLVSVLCFATPGEPMESDPDVEDIAADADTGGCLADCHGVRDDPLEAPEAAPLEMVALLELVRERLAPDEVFQGPELEAAADPADIELEPVDEFPMELEAESGDG